MSAFFIRATIIKFVMMRTQIPSQLLRCRCIRLCTIDCISLNSVNEVYRVVH